MFIWTEWTEWIPLPHARSRSTPFSDRLYHFHVTISRCCKDLSTVSFLAQLDSGYLCLQNAFHELNGFSPRVNEHILFLGSFWTAYPFAFRLFCLMVAFQPSMDRNPITKKNIEKLSHVTNSLNYSRQTTNLDTPATNYIALIIKLSLLDQRVLQFHH